MVVCHLWRRISGVEEEVARRTDFDDGSINSRDAAGKRLAPRHHGQCLGVDAVFLGEDARRQGVRGVAREDRHAGLEDGRAVVEGGNDPVDGAAAFGIAGIERLLLGVEALVTRQQRGVDVEHPASPALGEGRIEKMRMKPARQTISARQPSRTVWMCVVEGVAGRQSPCATATAVECRRRAAIARPGASGLVATTRRRSRRDSRAASAASISADMLRAAARDQDRDALAFTERSRAFEGHGFVGAIDQRADDRRLLAGLAEAGDQPLGVLGRDHRQHADAAVEGAQHFALGDAAGLASQPKTGGTATASRSMCAARCVGQDAGDVVDEAAAGDVGERLDADAGAQRREQRLHVDAGRRRAARRRASVPASNGAGADQASPDTSTILRTSE